jgi:hypothetical protein
LRGAFLRAADFFRAGFFADDLVFLPAAAFAFARFLLVFFFADISRQSITPSALNRAPLSFSGKTS